MQRKWRRDWKRANPNQPQTGQSNPNTNVNPLKILAKHILPPVAAASIMLAGLTGGYANPADGQITSGTGTINQTGNTTTITQTSGKLGINWQSFNIGAGEKVQFIQPGSRSVALNRIVGSDASRIYGQLTANGQVFLINPNGILFAPGSQLNVGGLVASTLDISDRDFQAGKYKFTGNGGTVVNQGIITAANGGYVALLAAAVKNDGVIVAQQGTVALGAGKTVTLDMTGDGLLNLAVDQGAVNASAANHSLIQADGGQVIMAASAADKLARTVVNNSGIVRARSFNNQNGVIILDGGPHGTVETDGTLDASGKNANQTGGTVKVLGDKVTLAADAKIDVSGANGGGTALIGSNAQGKGSERNATQTTVNNGATINADAINSGNGGKVVVWSDGTTNYAGTISAKGGVNGGNGGTVETSGKNTLKVTGTVNAGAAAGSGGSWLLDPADITIDSAAATSIADSLNNKTDVTITTASGNSGNGDITIASPVNWTGGGSLTFLADRDITVNNTISGAGIGALTLSAYRNVNVYAPISNSAGASVKLRADNSGTGQGTVSFTNGTNIGRVTTDGPVSIYYNLATKTTATINGTSVTVNDYNNKIDYSPSVSAYTGGKTAGLTAYMLINNVYDLQYIGKDAVTLAGTYALGKDVDASGTANWNLGLFSSGVYAGFTPVGTAGTPFTGIFDGGGQIISNLNIAGYSGAPACVGLFGSTSGSIIRNVGLKDLKIGIAGTSATTCAGGLAGYASNTTIANCYTTGAIGAVSTIYVGGLVGYADGGAITDSYNSAAISDFTLTLAGLYVGGLIGESNTTVRNSYNTGTVKTSSSYNWNVSSSVGVVYGNYYTGGLAGHQTGGAIAGCYNVGNVAYQNNGRYLNWYMGGLVGTIQGGSVTDCYSAGLESYSDGYGGVKYVGGLVGYNPNSLTVTRSFWDTTTSAQSSSAAGTGLTTAQLMDSATLTSLGWDFTTSGDWFVIDGQTYPFRRAEYSTTIVNGHQLQLMAINPTANYTLGQDIAMSNYNMAAAGGFAPIGSESVPFTGTLNGNGYSISGLTIKNPGSTALGLFGYTGTGAAISKVDLIGVSIIGPGNSYVGSLVGYNGTGAAITGCSVAGQITGSGAGSAVGGLVGYNTGSIDNSSSEATITGSGAGDEIGGLVGYNAGSIDSSTGAVTVTGSGAGSAVGGLAGRNDGAIINGVIVCSTVSGVGDLGGLAGLNNGSLAESFSIGTVSGSGNIGGLAGTNAGHITDCYVNETGTVTGTDTASYVGGLVGANRGTIATSYDAGTVTGGGVTGGLVGNGEGGTLTAAVWDIGNSRQAYGVGSDHGAAGVTGLTAAQMGKEANYSGDWDFTDKWTLNGARPILQRDYHNAGAISTASQLAAISNNLNGIYYLLADIDLSGLEWAPISTFSGILDGNGYIINGLFIYRPNEAINVGLFGKINGATIRNLGLENVNITGSYTIGSLAGEADGSKIANCYSTGTVSTVGVNGFGVAVGGLVGILTKNATVNSTLTNCYSSAAVTGAGDGIIDESGNRLGSGRAVGGLLGIVNGANISNSYSTGSVSDSGYYAGGVGGFIGKQTGYDTILNCYTTSQVTSTGYNGDVAGFVGYLSAFNSSYINCYSAGTVAHLGAGAGLPIYAFGCGSTGDAPYTSCYWSIDTYGATAVGSNCTKPNKLKNHLTGRSTTDMMNHSMYSGWDFNSTWYMIDGETLPFLRSEYSTTIRNAHQLQLMVMNLSSDYVLRNNIDLSSYAMSAGGFVPVGSGDPVSNGTPFTGAFNGNGYYITGLAINNPVSTTAGLFGYINADASISRVGLTGANITGGANNRYVGSLVGYNDGGCITDSYSAGVVSGSDSVISIGGLVGYNKGAVASCYTINTVSGYNNVGGVAGANAGSITDSYYDVAGVVTSLAAGTYAGGITGANSGTIATSYSAGLVKTASGGTAGALAGTNGDRGTISNSVWDSETSGQVNGVGDNPAASGVINLTTAAMGNQANYVADWDFTGTWSVTDGLRPVLRWEYQGSNVITNLSQLRMISADLSGVYILGANIDLTGLWTPLGSADHPFTGILKGNGYTLSGLDIENSASTAIGLFGYTQAAGISGVSLTGVNIVANVNNRYVGSLVGYNGSGSSVTNSSSAGTITANGDGSYVGGLVGYNAGSIESSSNAVAVNAGGDGGYAGGLVGVNAGSLTSCYNTGAVSSSGAGSYIGGLAGENPGSITYSYNTGTTNGGGAGNYIGGLAGENPGSITYSYNIGATIGSSAGSYIGGLAGENPGSITYSYNTGVTTGGGANSYVGGLVGNNAGNVAYDYCISVTTGSGNSSSVGGLVGANTGSINYAYSVGTTTGTDGSTTGGLVGTNGDTSTLTHARWNTETSEQANGIGAGSLVGVQDMQGLNIADLMKSGSYTGWDLTGTWGQIEGLSFPYLKGLYNGTPQFISGFVQDGGIGKTIKLMHNGTVAGQTTTCAANGFYYLPVLSDNALASSDLLLTYVAGDSGFKATSVYLYEGGAGMTGINLEPDTLVVNGGSGTITSYDLYKVKGTASSADIIYSTQFSPYSFHNADVTNLTVEGSLKATHYSPCRGNITATRSITITTPGDLIINDWIDVNETDQQFIAGGDININTGGDFVVNYGSDWHSDEFDYWSIPNNKPRLIAGGNINIVCGGYFVNKTGGNILTEDMGVNGRAYFTTLNGNNIFQLTGNGRWLITAKDKLVYAANSLYFDLRPIFSSLDGQMSEGENVRHFNPSDELIRDTAGGLAYDFALWSSDGTTIPAAGNGFIYTSVNPLLRSLTSRQLMRQEAIAGTRGESTSQREGVLFFGNNPELGPEILPFLTVIDTGLAPTSDADKLNWDYRSDDK